MARLIERQEVFVATKNGNTFMPLPMDPLEARAAGFSDREHFDNKFEVVGYMVKTGIGPDGQTESNTDTDRPIPSGRLLHEVRKRVAHNAEVNTPQTPPVVPKEQLGMRLEFEK
ncbi:MAG: hypothetical protein KA035_00290 [Candidatus Levybacteria bacterium]|nr:hypothetical protein [Candidatus Levybacteria bacterium]